jgi:hypothetical protein
MRRSFPFFSNHLPAVVPVAKSDPDPIDRSPRQSEDWVGKLSIRSNNASAELTGQIGFGGFAISRQQQLSPAAHR